jgi:hypothetical protein
MQFNSTICILLPNLANYFGPSTNYSIHFLMVCIYLLTALLKVRLAPASGDWFMVARECALIIAVPGLFGDLGEMPPCELSNRGGSVLWVLVYKWN